MFNITQRQQCGAAALLLIAAAFFGAHRFGLSVSGGHEEILVPFGDERAGPVVVELAGDVNSRGIYFMPGGARVSDLLQAAGDGVTDFADGSDLSRVLKPAARVVVRTESGRTATVRLDRMNSAQRFFLRLPMNLNAAGVEDLMRVPGIGEKTAERIVAHRGEKGPFRKLESLMDVRGIKEKKFAKFRPYFCIEP